MIGLSAIALLVTAQICVENVPDPNPWRWNDEQVYLATTIINYAEHNGLDPYDMLAIAWVESNINPKAASPTGDFGMFQVNCKLWWKDLGYSSWAGCRKGMMDPPLNIKAAAHVIKTYERYRRCRKDKKFACYNGGPYWTRSKKLERVKSYSKRVRNVKWRLKKHYSSWIEQYLQANS